METVGLIARAVIAIGDCMAQLVSYFSKWHGSSSAPSAMGA